MNTSHARPVRAGFLAAGFIAMLLALATSLSQAEADGGAIQVSNQVAGPYQVSVFTDPSPIQVGTVDVSVLVQKAGSNDLVQDASVTITAEPVGHAGETGRYEATHELATNKLYYAANVRLPSEGRWRIGVQLEGTMGNGATSFEVEATSETLLDRPLLLMGAIAVPVVLVLAWLMMGRSSAPGEGK